MTTRTVSLFSNLNMFPTAEYCLKAKRASEGDYSNPYEPSGATFSDRVRIA